MNSKRNLSKIILPVMAASLVSSVGYDTITSQVAFAKSGVAIPGLAKGGMVAPFMAALEAGEYTFEQYDKSLIESLRNDEHFKRNKIDLDFLLQTRSDLQNDFARFMTTYVSSQQYEQTRKFFGLILDRVKQAEPIDFQTRQTVVYKTYVGLAMYIALIDRPDIIGAMTMDLNYWSPLFSAASLVGVMTALAFNRFMNSGRGVLNSYKNLVKTVEKIQTHDIRAGEKASMRFAFQHLIGYRPKPLLFTTKSRCIYVFQ